MVSFGYACLGGLEVPKSSDGNPPIQFELRTEASTSVGLV
jgi:hypothetical protein